MWLKLSRRPPPFSATENESRKTVKENSLRRLFIHARSWQRAERKHRRKKRKFSRIRGWVAMPQYDFYQAHRLPSFYLCCLTWQFEITSGRFVSRRGSSLSVPQLFSLSHLGAFVLTKSSRCFTAVARRKYCNGNHQKRYRCFVPSILFSWLVNTLKQLISYKWRCPFRFFFQIFSKR